MKKCLAALLLTVLVLVGCSGPDGEIYGKAKVLAYVSTLCREPYTLVGTELVAQTPDDMRYDFVTNERGLAFSAHSTLVPIMIDASVTNFYSKSITCNYVQAVHELYREDVKAALSQGDTWLPEHQWMYLINFSDLDNVVDTLLSGDRVYAEELNWNSPQFLQKNPIATVHLIWHRSAEEAAAHETWTNITDVRLTGQLTRQVLYDALANRYAQLYVNGKIENGDGIPQEYLKDKHVSRLDTLTLDGKPLLYDTEDNPYNGLGLTTESYAYSWYSDTAGSYLLASDVGYMSDKSSFPLILREYVLALGGSYSRETNDDESVSRWTIGNDSWTLISRMKNRGVKEWRVTKNGVPLDLDWYTVDEERDIGATFCVGVPVEDFCQLFNLNYTVDETAGVLAFTSR